MDRRRFVGLVVAGGAAATMVAGAGALAWRSWRIREVGAQKIRYLGAPVTRGPAPRGVPYLPLGVVAGAFVGKPVLHWPPTLKRTPEDVLAWHRGCGREAAPGLQDGYAGDEVLRYHVGEGSPLRPWYADRDGEPIRPEHFPDVGFGARFRWRSEGASGDDVVTGVLVKMGRERLVHDVAPAPPGLGITKKEFDAVLSVIFHEDFVAVSDACTHLCCRVTWKEGDAASQHGAAEQLYCPCHAAAYDLARPAAYTLGHEAA